MLAPSARREAHHGTGNKNCVRVIRAVRKVVVARKRRLHEPVYGKLLLDLGAERSGKRHRIPALRRSRKHVVIDAVRRERRKIHSGRAVRQRQSRRRWHRLAVRGVGESDSSIEGLPYIGNMDGRRCRRLLARPCGSKGERRNRLDLEVPAVVMILSGEVDAKPRCRLHHIAAVRHRNKHTASRQKSVGRPDVVLAAVAAVVEGIDGKQHPVAIRVSILH